MWPEDKQEQQKFCYECAHLIGDRDYMESSGNWKCGAPPNCLGEKINLLTGEPIKLYRVVYCTEHRMMDQKSFPTCGSEGKWYEEYKRPQLLDKEPILSPSRKGRVTESDLANL